MATGEGGEDAFAWGGNMIAGFLRGRYEPIRREVDPETKAKLLERYTRSLRELEVAKSQLQSEKVETYGQIKAQLLASSASGMAALAEAAKAGAQGAQAAAEMQKVFLSQDSEFTAAAAHRIPDEKAMGVVNDAARSAYDAGTNADTESFRGALDGAWKGDTFDEAAASQGVFQALDDAGVGEYLRNSNAALNDPGLNKNTSTFYWTAHDAESSARDAIHGILEQKERELLASMPKEEQPNYRGILTKYADAYVAQKVSPYFTGAVPAGTRAAAEEENAVANQIIMEREAKTWEIASKYGIPREALRRFYAIQDETHALVKDPGTFAAEIEKMPYPQSFDTLRDEILAQMKLLKDGEPDPMELAIAKMTDAVPNFATWAASMRFPTVERAAIYAARHPNELVTFNRWQAEDPGIVLEPDTLREKIRSYGLAQQKDGGEIGYFTRRAERFFGARVAGKAPKTVKAAPPPKLPPPNLDGLPEAGDDAARALQFQSAADRIEVEAPGQPGTVDLPVYDLTGAQVRPVRSSVLDASGQPSRVVDMGDGYVYQELDDGTFVILESPTSGGGQRLKPGDPGWLELRAEVEKWNGPFNVTQMAHLRRGGEILETETGVAPAQPAPAPVAAAAPVAAPAPVASPAPAPASAAAPAAAPAGGSRAGGLDRAAQATGTTPPKVMGPAKAPVPVKAVVPSTRPEIRDPAAEDLDEDARAEASADRVMARAEAVVPEGQGKPTGSRADAAIAAAQAAYDAVKGTVDDTVTASQKAAQARNSQKAKDAREAARTRGLLAEKARGGVAGEEAPPASKVYGPDEEDDED